MTWGSADYSSEILYKIWKRFIIDKIKRRQKKNGVTSRVLKRVPRGIILSEVGRRRGGKGKRRNKQYAQDVLVVSISLFL